MYALTNQSGGQALGTPDVCKTPAPPGSPVPVTYPNMVMTQMCNASTCSQKVKITGMKSFNMKTKWIQSTGDEAGTVGGVTSNMNMGEVGFAKGSAVVYIEGSPAVFQTSTTKHNGSCPNVPMGSVVQAPQMVVDIGK